MTNVLTGMSRRSGKSDAFKWLSKELKERGFNIIESNCNKGRDITWCVRDELSELHCGDINEVEKMINKQYPLSKLDVPIKNQ